MELMDRAEPANGTPGKRELRHSRQGPGRWNRKRIVPTTRLGNAFLGLKVKAGDLPRRMWRS
jgi:hypothetical protein